MHMKLLEKLDTRWNKAGTYRSRWGLFLCDYCNQEVEKTLSVGYKIKSCGCAQYEISSKTHTTHGQTPKSLYQRWVNMRNRCYNKNVPDYKYYGSKGIKVYAEWRNDYVTFKKWALKNGFREGLALCRKDVKKNYTPENCFFTKKTHFAFNRTTTKLNWDTVGIIRLLYKDGIMRQNQLSKKFKVSQSTINSIVNNSAWVEK
jgi:predicted DNA-binding protein (UPF0251 family)